MKKSILFIAVILALSCCSSVSTPDSPPARNLTVAGETANFLQMTQAPGGHIVAWWVEKDAQTGDKYIHLSKSADPEPIFRERRRIPSSRKVHAGGEHMPKLVIKPDGIYVLVFVRRNHKSKAPFASSILYTQSFDAGGTWTVPQRIHSDTNLDNSHGFPDAVLLPDGEVGAVWLDGRHHLDHSTLYFAKTYGRNGFTKDKKIGGPSCQCCKLDMYVDKDKTLHLVYRGLTEHNIRDIQHITSDDNGNSFSLPSRVSDDNWQIQACPHNGPSVSKTQDTLYVLWYSEGGEKGLYYTKSANNAQSFSSREKLTTQAKHPYIASLGHSALAIWDEIYQHDQETYRRVNMCIISGGRVTQSEYISSSHVETFMPYLSQTDNGDIIATWTQGSENGNKLYYRKFSVK